MCACVYAFVSGYPRLVLKNKYCSFSLVIPLIKDRWMDEKEAKIMHFLFFCFRRNSRNFVLTYFWVMSIVHFTKYAKISFSPPIAMIFKTRFLETNTNASFVMHMTHLGYYWLQKRLFRRLFWYAICYWAVVG